MKRLLLGCLLLALWVGQAQGAPRSGEIARGEYLARAGNCISCHTLPGGPAFAGGPALRTPFGTFFGPNITPDTPTGIGAWTRDDLWRALHEGRSRDGTLLYPAFPYTNYTRIRRTDSDALYAYLKSLRPVHRPNKAHELSFPYDQRRLLVAWRALYFRPGEFRPERRRSAQWNRGAYLVQGLGHCDACHGARNLLGATDGGAGLGGAAMLGQGWYAPALDGGRESASGAWELRDLVALLKTGVSNRGAVYGPMARVVQDSLQHLEEADLLAVATYLKSLAPVQVVPEDAERSAFETGARVYEAQCKGCHQVDGSGAPPAYPPLAGNPSVQGKSTINTVRMVLLGGFPPSTGSNPRPYGMPPFQHVLSDAGVAAVVTYLRQAWGNRAEAVSPAEVARLRGLPAD